MFYLNDGTYSNLNVHISAATTTNKQKLKSGTLDHLENDVETTTKITATNKRPVLLHQQQLDIEDTHTESRHASFELFVQVLI